MNLTRLTTLGLAACLFLLTPGCDSPPADTGGGSPGGDTRLLQAQDRAIQTILEAFRSSDARLRVNAIEAMQPRPDRVLPMVQLGLQDPNEAVRYAALVTVGKLELDSMGPAARERQDDPSPHVQAAAIFATHQTMGPEAAEMSRLGRLIASGDPGLRSNVANVLGEMDDASARVLLRDMADEELPMANAAQRTITRLQIAEAMVKLEQQMRFREGDGQVEYAPGSLAALRAAMFSTDYEARVLAVQILGRLGDQSMAPGIRQFIIADEPIELRLAAVEAVHRLGLPAGGRLAVRAAGFQGSDYANEARRFIRNNRGSALVPYYQRLLEDPQQLNQTAASVRAQAAATLAFVPGGESADALLDLLNDPSAQVRLAAAAAVIDRTSPR
jgi:HEAT repeat protein